VNTLERVGRRPSPKKRISRPHTLYRIYTVGHFVRPIKAKQAALPDTALTYGTGQKVSTICPNKTGMRPSSELRV
jgi:hypothetical protein